MSRRSYFSVAQNVFEAGLVAPKGSEGMWEMISTVINGIYSVSTIFSVSTRPVV